MAPLTVPEWNGKTNGDLADYAQDLEAVIARAQLKLKGLREWTEKLNEE